MLARATVCCRRASPFGEPAVAARDLPAIAKGIVDAADERSETSAPALEARVLHAAHGYLRVMCEEPLA
ncbi:MULTISPECIES: hypothetical protein [Burkholderia]|uniref:Uncharacterized protein n=2 Tax=Burkholderia humptydooensis TaxID=430531 RepID=A0A7U4PAS1_9BURK|nr:MULTISPECIES: hypothetical protein [Burkholderia]AGK50320.1 transcriptional regulator domain protein [Burkholderia thailandensis MSMB121]ATF33098.1 hypothetical protein CO709_06885 [Burkholderia thailandensis]AJY40130.1 transcriptional regulator domain protein [Burkholderia sp. 2002721687]ALX46114.1 hypothetical protein AQ610_27395 [Burkholderia humptydooensis]EIP87142.1 hypothetical protein A33K_16745 [Burkholderia humptydooensis MSMB43]